VTCSSPNRETHHVFGGPAADRLSREFAGTGALSAPREADPELVREDSERLAVGLPRILDHLPG
jgi:hypothetical protein